MKFMTNSYHYTKELNLSSLMLNLTKLDFKLHYDIYALNLRNPIHYALCMINAYDLCLTCNSSLEWCSIT